MNHRRIDMTQALEQLRHAAAAMGRDAAYMEVCGTHTMAAFRSGLHALLPANISLRSGPGCPVCVTAQQDIDLLIELASDQPVTLCTYGDMLRVPGGPSNGSLEKVRGSGGDVRVVYSAADAVQLAADQPDRQIVFAAIGFETTAPATASAVLDAAERDLQNFSILCLHKRVMPALIALLSSESLAIAGLLLPGHVAVITGWQHFAPLAERFAIPCVVSGFEPVHMAAALATLAEMTVEHRTALANCYPEAVTAEGNAIAQQMIDHVFQPCLARWRGLGDIAESGMELRPAYARFDAMQRFALMRGDDHENPACLCGKIITAAAQPTDCRLFASACTPVRPLGPCMVSGEGTCAAWFKHRRSA